MVGLIAWFHARLRQLEADRSAATTELAAEVEVVRAQLAEVTERLDFAERLLTRGRAESERPRSP
jgi:hypothetical protein